MKRNLFNQYIKDADFRGLFITEMGWNRFRGQAELAPIVIDDTEYRVTTVAERNGFQVLACPVTEMPGATVCRRIDSKLRRNANDYICIFYIRGTEHQQWIVPVKTVEKRGIVTIEYENADQTDFLFSKIPGLTFGIDEQTTIVDVKERIQGAFSVNSEKITKDFYTCFRKEHKAFANFISGIDDRIPASENRNKQWYTSVMLNRLMFCYFIQKKGFLDGNFDYLQEKLKWVQRERGENRFFNTFYRGFLSGLFHDGLNSPRHGDDFEDVYGRIPYLNGGMFDDHQIERDYADLDIADEAFERLFNFFDTWRWHLDTRITASGKDINPDVLGYIFEQYINDRAQMGAYYTKEDITEYIGKNCILPFLMDKVAETSPEAFKSDGYVWSTLRDSADRYVYDAVKKGYTPDWRSRIPENIAVGLDATRPDLLERRKDWNTKTQDAFALPTEIWRETVERLGRCETVLRKIRDGEITHINDFITYNLDIRSFVYDLLSGTDDRLFVLHFYKALQRVTILDPTCGSGAFLFAAMNILEPLYEICIERIQELNARNANWFKPELEEIAHKYRSNIQYFIYKSIILRNLYGVDIMVEATEIAKLRLFLKLMAVVEVDFRADNMGLDPLPDIDFNIRCGNTLVGYATEEDLNQSLDFATDIYQELSNQEFREKVETEMQLVSTAYETFKSVQLTQNEDMAAFKQAKQGLSDRLTALNGLLNRHLHAATMPSMTYDSWFETHQPFHWLAEFYRIIHDNGGFDVIIGNPPYVEYSKRNVQYIIQSFDTLKSANLYSFVFERAFQIGCNKIALIVQLSSVGTIGMESLQRFLVENSKIIRYSCFPERPQQLFEGACIALSIIICDKGHDINEQIYSAGVYRTAREFRPYLFQNISSHRIDLRKYLLPQLSLFPKYKYIIEQNIFLKLLKHKPLSNQLSNVKTSNNCITYRTAGGRYWKIFLNRPFANESTSNKNKPLLNSFHKNIAVAILNSNLFWLFYVGYFDLYNLKDYMIFAFPYTPSPMCDSELKKLGKTLMDSYERHKVENTQFIKSKQQMNIFESFNPSLSKPIIDEIDKVLAKHYGFTEEELDFIINYDIKYRMGEELNEE